MRGDGDGSFARLEMLLPVLLRPLEYAGPPRGSE